MDMLDGLLDGPRARSAFLLRSIMNPPWSIRIEDESPLTIVTPINGWAWIIKPQSEPVRLVPGDLAVVTGPKHYTIADEPGTEPTVIVYPGQRCTSAADGRSLVDEWSLGIRTWGEQAEGATVLFTASYERAGEVSRSLLAALPSLLVLTRQEWDSPLVPLLVQEVGQDGPGQRAMLDRLLDSLLIAVLRTWFAGQRDQAPAWYRAQGDPVVGRALRLLQHAPDHPWTVADLGRETGVSRAVLARRFTELVGEPPMAYLTGWRLALAADLLCQPDLTLEAVARKVGYASAFALSSAFKRERGISPQQHRKLAASA
ncbi:AraC family transcriptional regulator [Microlunatus speluncae]|uniref:AraC family transcriptional regulator n=1 Tax=Microlunatus speluncae TaxID=2594267 RepID=UPI0012662D07|nr:AraC family transcriptional regulator [Microlunatus speluncae]